MSSADILAFTQSPLDRGGNNRTDESWIAEQAESPQARAILYWRGQPFVDSGQLVWIKGAALEWLPVEGPLIFLGLQDGAPRLAAMLDPDTEAPDPGVAGEFMDLRMGAASLSADEAGIAGHARSLIEWRGRHQHCAVCGARTRQAEGGGKRVCTQCEAEHFPRVDPVAIMWITEGGRALLGRQGYWPEGIYSALAGFIEPGETIEDACRRETMEEAGVELGAVRYVESQPWPFPSSLMIGLHADARSVEIKIDAKELEDARWYSREEVAAALEGRSETLVMPPSAAIARRLAERWIAGELD